MEIKPGFWPYKSKITILNGLMKVAFKETFSFITDWGRPTMVIPKGTIGRARETRIKDQVFLLVEVSPEGCTSDIIVSARPEEVETIP